MKYKIFNEQRKSIKVYNEQQLGQYNTIVQVDYNAGQYSEWQEID